MKLTVAFLLIALSLQLNGQKHILGFSTLSIIGNHTNYYDNGETECYVSLSDAEISFVDPFKIRTYEVTRKFISWFDGCNCMATYYELKPNNDGSELIAYIPNEKKLLIFSESFTYIYAGCFHDSY